MNIIKKFNDMIIKEAKQYQKVEEYDYASFYDQFYYDSLEDIKITISSEEDLVFYDSTDVIEFLEENLYEDYTIVVYYNGLNELDVITNTMFNTLVDVSNFKKEEQKYIIRFMFKDFYDTFRDCSSLEQEFQGIIDIIENESIENIISLFYDDEELSNTILTFYCDDIIKGNEYLENEVLEQELTTEFKNDTIFIYQNINEYLRDKLLKIVDSLEMIGYLEENAIDFLASYLSLNHSLKIFSSSLYNKIYSVEDDEIYFKKYFVILVIYDFCQSIYANKGTSEELRYLNFINNNTLEDSYSLFINDREFRICALKHFILFNSYGMISDTNDFDKQIQKKFQPISTVDRLVRKKISS